MTAEGIEKATERKGTYSAALEIYMRTPVDNAIVMGF